MSLGTTVAPYESSTVSPAYSSGSTIIQSDPIIEQPMIERSLNDTIVPSSHSIQYESAKPAIESDAAILTVSVPQNATVTVNEHPTTSGGSVRKFMSQGLKQGYVYTYVVKVTYDRDGDQKTDSQEVKLRAGETKALNFETAATQTDAADQIDDSSASSQPVDQDLVTVVQLHVPSDAKVTLAGNPTNGNGVLRTFRTNRLTAGQQWKGYTVQVVAVVNGQSITQQRTIDVTAGSTNELTFDFGNTDSIALR